mgnify:CR=1 FL=1
MRIPDFLNGFLAQLTAKQAEQMHDFIDGSHDLSLQMLDALPASYRVQCFQQAVKSRVQSARDTSSRGRVGTPAQYAAGATSSPGRVATPAQCAAAVLKGQKAKAKRDAARITVKDLTG